MKNTLFVLAGIALVILFASHVQLGRAKALIGDKSESRSSPVSSKSAGAGLEPGASRRSQSFEKIHTYLCEIAHLYDSPLGRDEAKESIRSLLSSNEDLTLQVIAAMEDPVVENGRLPQEAPLYDFALIGSALGEFYASKEGDFTDLYERVSPAFKNWKIVHDTLNSFIRETDDMDRLRQVFSWLKEDPEDDFRYEAASSLGVVIAANNFDESVELMGLLPQGRTSSRYLSSLIMEYSQERTEKIGLLLRDLPESQNLSEAIGVYVDEVAAFDPSTAMEWALSITDDGERDFAVFRVSKVWRKSDPESFESWKSAQVYTK